MAKVTMTITDLPDQNLGITISAEPPMPLTNGELDTTDDAATPAMAAAIIAANVLGDVGSGDFSFFSAEKEAQARAIFAAMSKPPGERPQG